MHIENKVQGTAKYEVAACHLILPLTLELHQAQIFRWQDSN